MLSSVTTGVEAGAAVFTVLLMGSQLVKGEFKKIDEKKHAEELKKIGEITNAAFIKAPHLEPIFTRSKPDDEKSPLKGPVLTQATFKSIAKCKPNFENKALDRYVRHVQNAVSYLYEFHSARLRRNWLYKGDLEDPTSSVLCYIALKLGLECVTFTDNQRALATLQALATLTKKFASARDPNTKTTFRFARLTQIYDELNIAIFLLKDHSLSLSLTERVKEFLSVYDDIAQGLLTCAIKMIVPNDQWYLLDSFNPQRLRLGLLRHEYDYWEGWPVKIQVSENKVMLPDAHLSDWIKISAEDYSLALALEDEKGKSGDFINPHKFDLVEPLDYKHIARIYKHSRNFMTMTVAPVSESKATSHFVTVTQPELMRSRVQFSSNLMKLLHYANVNRFFGAWLRNELLRVGQDYFDLPENNIYMFAALNEFRNQMMRLTQMEATKLSEMLTDQHKAMLNEKEDDGLYDELKTNLEMIQKRGNEVITALINGHNDKLRHKHHDIDTKKLNPVFLREGDTLMWVPHFMAERFELKIDLPVQLVKKEEEPAPNPTIKMYRTLAKISNRISEIEQTQQDVGINHYNQIYAYLLALLMHAQEISNDRTDERRDKAAHLFGLLKAYDDKFLVFLKKSLSERQSSVKNFALDIEISLINGANKFIDIHKAGTITFFKTRTRKLATQFKQECKSLARQIGAR